MIIDTHVHIGRGERLSDTYQVDCSAEAIIAAMDEAGVEMSCIMPVFYANYEQGIQEVREAVAAHPNRFLGYARVNLQHERRARTAQEMSRGVRPPRREAPPGHGRRLPDASAHGTHG
jgi:predicted TIM-barrel fold metal-dependent hydrolase